MRVDMDSVADQPNWREVRTGRIMRRLFRNELRRGVTLLSAASTNTAKTWDTTAGKNPDQDVATLAIVFGDAAGVAPTRALFGQQAFNSRAISYGAQNNAAGYAGAAASNDQIASRCGVDQIYVSKERYTTSATARTQITNNLVIIYNAEAGQTPEDSSSIKRFVSNTLAGGLISVFEQRINAKLIDITVEMYSNIIITSTLGIQQITVS